MNYIFAFIDGLLVMSAVLAALTFFPMGRYGHFLSGSYPIVKKPQGRCVRDRWKS